MQQRPRRQSKEEAVGKKIQASNGLQRSRGKFLRKPPGRLGDLIDLVNCFPLDALQSGSMSPESLRATIEAQLALEGKTKSDVSFYERLDSTALETAANLPSELRDYVWRREWKGDSFRVEPMVIDPHVWSAITGKKKSQSTIFFPLALPNVFLRYVEAWDACEKLRAIAKAARDPHERWKLLKLGRHESMTSGVQIDTEGMIRERKSLFSRVIEGQKIEAARIRICPVCHLIFWAGRLDAQQCGARKCKSALSSQLNRNPELRELYNSARRRKRQTRREGQKALSEAKKGK